MEAPNGSATVQGEAGSSGRSAGSAPRARSRAKAGKGATRSSSDGSFPAAAPPAAAAETNLASGLSMGSSASGFVVNVNVGYGFIRPHLQPGLGLYFNSNCLLPSGDRQTDLTASNPTGGTSGNLTQHIQLGDQVEFILAPSNRGNGFSAAQVRVTHRASANGSTLPAQQQQQHNQQQKQQQQQQQPIAVLQGIIKQITSRNADWRARQEPGGIITYQPLPPEGSTEHPAEEELAYGASDVVRSRIHLKIGDRVTFQISQRWEEKRASQVQLVPGSRQPEQQANAPRLRGFVYSFNPLSGRGSIRRADRQGQPSFALANVQLDSQAVLTTNSEVEFSMGEDGPHKLVAVNIMVLPPGSIPDSELLEGRVSGRVTRVPATPDGQARERPGAIRCDDADLGSIVSFSSQEVSRCVGTPLQEGDDVEFVRQVHRRSGAVHAVDLKLNSRGSDRSELGQIQHLKPKFGFIKCCERRSNLFFHYDALVPGLSATDLALGDDVEFTVGLEAVPQDRGDQPPRPVALRVAKAPKGAAVFETKEAQVQVGTVVERLLNNGFRVVSSGVLELAEADGQRTRLTFGADDLVGGEQPYHPQPGDRVTFRICTRHKAAQDGQAVGGTAARHAGRRATDVALQRFEGTCADKLPSYGFVDVAEPRPEGVPPRLWFSIGEVAGAAPVKGQAVAGSLGVNSKGEVVAKAVRVVPQQEGQAAELEAAAPSSAQRPKLKQVSSSGESVRKPPPARIAAGPDGSKGFAVGRGRGLPATPAAPIPPARAPGSSSLKVTLSGRLLNPSAMEFVPGASLQCNSSSGLPTSAAAATPPLASSAPAAALLSPEEVPVASALPSQGALAAAPAPGDDISTSLALPACDRTPPLGAPAVSEHLTRVGSVPSAEAFTSLLSFGGTSSEAVDIPVVTAPNGLEAGSSMQTPREPEIETAD